MLAYLKEIAGNHTIIFISTWHECLVISSNMCIVNILTITLWKPITVFMCNIILFVAYHVILNEYRNNLVVNFIVWSQRVVKLMSVNVVTVILHTCAIVYINNFHKWLHKFDRIMSVRLWCLSSIMKMPNILFPNEFCVLARFVES